MNPHRVLVIDDEPDMRRMIEFHLSQEGFAVDGAADGVAALDLLSRNRYAIVLLDIQLPRMSGTEVLARVRERWPAQRVVTISSSVSDPSTTRALADGHLEKPFQLDELTRLCAALTGAVT